MPKSLLYRLFGVGRIPKLLGDRLRMEGVVVSDEGIGGSAADTIKWIQDLTQT